MLFIGNGRSLGLNNLVKGHIPVPVETSSQVEGRHWRCGAEVLSSQTLAIPSPGKEGGVFIIWTRVWDNFYASIYLFLRKKG